MSELPEPLPQDQATAVREIIALEHEADSPEADASTTRYRAAEFMMRLLGDGMPVKELARKIGKDPGHVRKCRNAWDAMHPEDKPPALEHEFQRYYSLANHAPKPPAESRRGGPGSSPDASTRVTNDDRLTTAQRCIADLDTATPLDGEALRVIADAVARLRPKRCSGWERVSVCAHPRHSGTPRGGHSRGARSPARGLGGGRAGRL